MKSKRIILVSMLVLFALMLATPAVSEPVCGDINCAGGGGNPNEPHFPPVQTVDVEVTPIQGEATLMVLERDSTTGEITTFGISTEFTGIGVQGETGTFEGEATKPTSSKMISNPNEFMLMGTLIVNSDPILEVSGTLIIGGVVVGPAGEELTGEIHGVRIVENERTGLMLVMGFTDYTRIDV